MSLSVSVEDLPRLIFVDNKNDCRLALTIGQGIDDSRELFQFLVDILTKGIVLLYGSGGPSVQLDALTATEIKVLTRKLNNAGIALTVDVTPRDARTKLGVSFEVSDPRLENDLSAYRLKLTDVTRTISVGFQIRF